jgi:hypothetical protein
MADTIFHANLQAAQEGADRTLTVREHLYGDDTFLDDLFDGHELSNE